MADIITRGMRAGHYHRRLCLGAKGAALGCDISTFWGLGSWGWRGANVFTKCKREHHAPNMLLKVMSELYNE